MAIIRDEVHAFFFSSSFFLFFEFVFFLGIDRQGQEYVIVLFLAVILSCPIYEQTEEILNRGLLG